MQFTDKFIQSLKAKPERYDLREQLGEGFAIRVSPNGKKSWVYIYSFEGRKRRMTLGNYPHLSLADARKQHRDALKILEKNKDPGLEKRRKEAEARDSLIMSDLIIEYIEKWAKSRKRSWQADERCLNKDIKPFWGKEKAKNITRRDVILLLDKIKDRGAPIQANRTLACIRRMFNFAIERDIIQTNPCSAVKAVAKENRRDRVLSPEEIKNFWEGLNAPDIIKPNPEDANSTNIIHAIRMSEHTKFALKFQLTTAQRKGEVISAEWNEIDLTAGWWTIPAEKAKNGNAHRVPLSTLALELLHEIKILSGNSRWLFPSTKSSKAKTANKTKKIKNHRENPLTLITEDKSVRGESIDHAMRRCTFKNVKQFTPHDLRRTAASHMTGMGISRLVVSKLLNHVETSVTAVYDRHSYDNEKKLALEAWGKKLSEIVKSTCTTSNVIHLQNVV